MCNNSGTPHRMCTNVDSLGKMLIVELGQNKPEKMLERYQAFIPAKKTCFQSFLVFLENCVCVIIAVQHMGYAQMQTPEKVLTMNLGQNKLEKKYYNGIKPYSCNENLFPSLPGFPKKLCLCNNSCTN